MTSSTKFYHVTQMILKMWSCDQSLVTHFTESSYHNFNFIRISPEKPLFFEGSTWFKVIYLELALVIALKFYASVAKRLKLKVRKCWGLIPTFVEVAWEKLVGGLLVSLLPFKIGLT